MGRPRHLIKSLGNESVRLVNENFRQAMQEQELANFKNGEIKTEQVLITQEIVQAPIITMVGSQVDGAHITPESITADKIEAGAITANKIEAGTITSELLATDSVTSDKIVSNAITASKMDVDTLSAISADLGDVNAGSLVVGDDVNKLWLNDSNDGALAIGGSVKGSAPFRVNAQGDVLMDSATLTGNVYALGGTLNNIIEADIDVGPYGRVRGGMTDFMTGVGFYEGFSGGAYKHSIGDPSGDYMSWDGTNMRLKGKLMLSSALSLSSVDAADLPLPPSSTSLNAPSGIE